jgi:hypothetical protein
MRSRARGNQIGIGRTFRGGHHSDGKQLNMFKARLPQKEQASQSAIKRSGPPPLVIAAHHQQADVLSHAQRQS